MFDFDSVSVVETCNELAAGDWGKTFKFNLKVIHVNKFYAASSVLRGENDKHSGKCLAFRW